MNGQHVVDVAPRVVAGDPAERLECLFDHHYDRLYRLARRLAPGREDALDLVQETFLKAARFPKSIPAGVKSEEAWLVRVLINICRDQWRKASVRERLNDSVIRGGYVHSERHPEVALVARAVIWQALNVLPPRRRAIVAMHEIEALSIPAIASVLGISAITVRWHLSIGRRELTRVLSTNKEVQK